MNAALQTSDFLNVEEYLASEEASESRHEYLNGTVYAMAGGSNAHNLIAGNLFAILHAKTRGGPCRVFFADVKLRLNLSGRTIFYYPDLMVTCDPRDRGPDYNENPSLIIEVLSETTERIDRSEKFWNYTQIESLQEYVLVAQDRKEAIIFRRGSSWAPEVLKGAEETLRLQSLKMEIPLTAIYEGVDLKK